MQISEIRQLVHDAIEGVRELVGDPLETHVLAEHLVTKNFTARLDLANLVLVVGEPNFNAMFKGRKKQLGWFFPLFHYGFEAAQHDVLDLVCIG